MTKTKETIQPKPSKIKKNHIFNDGDKLKTKYFFNDELHTIIYLNYDNQVKYKMGPNVKTCLNKLKNLSFVNGELISLPNFFKKDLNLKMAYIYKLALSNEEENAQDEIRVLYNSIINRKKLLKQFMYLFTPLILSISLYLIFSGINYFEEKEFFKSLKLIIEYKNVFIFAGIGNFLSTSKNIKNIEFDTSETKLAYAIFAFFKYLTSLFSAILLVFLYNSDIINIKIGMDSKEYIIRLLATLGGFSENIIPNIFEKFEEKVQV